MTDVLPSLPRKLERSDVRDGFDSGSREIDEWINRYALADQRANSAISYVSCLPQKVVVGFYSITVGAVAEAAAPTLTGRRSPSTLPCIVIPRLAVDRAWQGKGIGSGLLRDALERSALLSKAVAARGVLLHARDTEARAFFMSQVDFQPSPLDEWQLIIPMKDIQKFFGQPVE